MIRPIMKDPLFLAQKSFVATKDDLKIAQDLMDTLKANQDRCVGMAANMIGEKKNIIVVFDGIKQFIMINPIIINKSGKYETKEGCLSLTGQRKCTRYQNIEVEYYDTNFNKHKEKYNDFVAEIIQHEIDHLSGIII